MSTRRSKASPLTPLATPPFGGSPTVPFVAPFTGPFASPFAGSLTGPLGSFGPLSSPFTTPFTGPFPAPFTAPFSTASASGPMRSFPFANLSWPSANAVPDFLSRLAPWASPPRIDAKTYGQFLALQHKVWQMWIDSAQTIALRFMLAPPWMAASPWVRKEWVTMTTEKVAASHEAMSAAVKAGMSPESLTPHSLPRTAEGVLAPFTSRTRSNATRLGSRVLNGQALSAALEPLTGKVKRQGAATKAAARAAAKAAATATKRSRRRS